MTDNERHSQVSWPPPPRNRPNVQTVWPPKRRLWSAWQFFLCLLGIVSGGVCYCLTVDLWHIGVLFLCLTVALMLIAGAIVGRTSVEAGVGGVIGYAAIGLLFFAANLMQEHMVK